MAIVYQDYTVLVTCTSMAHWRNDTGKVKTAVLAVQPVLVLRWEAASATATSNDAAQFGI